MKKVVIALIVLGLLLLFLVKYWPFLYLFLVGPYKGEKFETWETRNESFKIRIDAYHEANGGFVPGAYYVFQSADSNSDQWRELMTFRHDDPIDIRKNQVRFVNDQIGFAFMGWMYAVTTDSGKSWSIWDGCKKLPNNRRCTYEIIRDIEILPNGTGKMTINPTPKESPLPELYTEDFGRNWHL